MKGNLAAGGEKLCWVYIAARDLEFCDLADSWCMLAQYLTGRQRIVEQQMRAINSQAEQAGGETASDESALHCNTPGCVFVAVAQLAW